MSSKLALFTLVLLPVFGMRSLCQAPSSNQDEITLHSRLAQQYLKEKRPDLAIPELQKVIALDPENVDARGNLGVLYFFRGNYQEAVPHLRSALNSQPSLWKIQGLLGLAEGRLGNGDASQQDLEAAFPHLTEEKFKAEVGGALIDEYSAAGNLERAAAVVSSLLSVQPTDSTLLYKSYRLYSDLAGKSMLTLALTSPDSAEMHQVMARELARHGDDASAIANYREAIKMNPQLPGLHSELGDLLYRSDDQKLQAEAETEFKAALAVNPRDETALLTHGTISEHRGDLKAAFEDYSHAFEFDPNNADACTQKAKMLIQMNRVEEATELFERAVQIDPTNYLAHYRLGSLYRKAGKTSEAKQQVAEYLKYRQMKEKLDEILHDMRYLSKRQLADEKDEK